MRITWLTVLGVILTSLAANSDEFEIGRQVYFQRCTGCHGTLRQGAVGPALTPDALASKPLWKVKNTLESGTVGGMPGFLNTLTVNDLRAVMLFIKDAPVSPPPPWTVQDVRGSWKLHVPIDQRPAVKSNDYQLDDIFAITLRDAGKVALVDGASKQIITTLDTGYAVHISRYSLDGRYLYTVGRDGKITMADLWMKKPQVVAEIRTALEARSIEAAKFGNQKLLIAGGYWPSHLALLDSDTLELRDLPLVQTLANLPPPSLPGKETRVGAMFASLLGPEFIMNLKEAGKILFVDYSTGALKFSGLAEGSGLLHDGGFDSTKQFLMSASVTPEGSFIAVTDIRARKQIALAPVASKPHPGRGANYIDPDYGRVWATGHLGSPDVSVISTDPKRPDAWTVVRRLQAAGAGSLFLKAHPGGRHLWVDASMNPDIGVQQTLIAHEIGNPMSSPKVISLVSLGIQNKFPNARLVHPEFNKAGNEVWISVWSPKTEASAVLVLDEATATLKQVLEDPEIITPTGKFNSYNTRFDIY